MLSLKDFYSTWRVLHVILNVPSKKADTVKDLANRVDVDLFWEGWLESDQREWDRFKELAHSLVFAWSQVRMCDEFLQ